MADHLAHGSANMTVQEDGEGYGVVEHHHVSDGEENGEEYAPEHDEYQEYDVGDVVMADGELGPGQDAYSEKVSPTGQGSILATQDNVEHGVVDQHEEEYAAYERDEGMEENGQALVDGHHHHHQDEHTQDLYDDQIDQPSHIYDANHVDTGSMDYSIITSDAAGSSSLAALSQVITSSVNQLANEMNTGEGQQQPQNDNEDIEPVHGEHGLRASQDPDDGIPEQDKDGHGGTGYDLDPHTPHRLGGDVNNAAVTPVRYKPQGRMMSESLGSEHNVTPVKRPLSSHSGDGGGNSRLKSKVWNWYDILPDGYRQCRFCAQKYGRLTATTILARHYHNHHGGGSPAAAGTPTAHRGSSSRHQRQDSHSHVGMPQAGQAVYNQAAAAAAAVAAAAANGGHGAESGHLFHPQTNGDATYVQDSLGGDAADNILRSVSDAVHHGPYDDSQLIIQDGYHPSMIAPPLTRLAVSPARRTLAAVGQFCAQNDMQRNLRTCVDLIGGAARRGARMLFLPESSDFLAETRNQPAELAQGLDGQFLREIQQAAKDSGIWVSLGIHEQPLTTGMPFNTNAVISDDGTLVSVYRKLHMFDVNVKDGPRLQESAVSTRGERVSDVVDTPVGKLGLSICYDLRFPEISQLLRQRGAQLLCYPSAFTEMTGAAHWETLLRARAVETQTYVFAAAQIGRHNAKRSSYGDAMIVDPWGVVVARCSRNSSEPTLAVAEVDLDYLEKVRREMPVFDHRRTDLFPDYAP